MAVVESRTESIIVLEPILIASMHYAENSEKKGPKKHGKHP